MTTRPSGIIRSLFRAPVYLYRWRCGRLLGHRFLLLIHTGRRTGRRRETVLEVVEYRKAGPELVVISAFGRSADWLRNIAAAPEPEIMVGGKRFIAAYRILDAEEAMDVIERYERRNRLIAPLLRLVLSHFLGWSYRGSESDRRRLVAELPLVAFRPR
jgi:deazaflavin-dependent oxidoreductase (nitroreductase family)